ncbi:MAG: hypothetical protein GWM98_16880 [Nitrospinaceae bacterium]|nr:hypothetical protein [Nitrospinaceae bacterium]NIR55856.1 hypothetical protein [Nitrospinaceae bacterium]NIT83137.1 hypothetical protein [Nitrospinaceae bacterium]NIW06925.1 hypothetical protein [Nitrospinaceae bacterium]NIX35500.1 hypothetical protein [Nitrospinaceae bacterium]
MTAGLLAFTLVFFGSWVFGARILSSFFRGLEAFALFGAVAWLVLTGWEVWMPGASDAEGNPGKRKGVNLDQTV